LADGKKQLAKSSWQLAIGSWQLAESSWQKVYIIRFGFSDDIFQGFQSYDSAFDPLLQIQ